MCVIRIWNLFLLCLKTKTSRFFFAQTFTKGEAGGNMKIQRNYMYILDFLEKILFFFFASTQQKNTWCTLGCLVGGWRWRVKGTLLLLKKIFFCFGFCMGNGKM